nr:START domain-containing protein [Tanacetum cinerariifolium]
MAIWASFRSYIIGWKNENFVGESDLQHISKLVMEKDGGLAWIAIMDRLPFDMSYQAWERDQHE